MPIWLRKFTFNNIDEFYRKEQEEYTKATGKGELVTANKPLAKPAIPDKNFTYSSTVSKK